MEKTRAAVQITTQLDIIAAKMCNDYCKYNKFESSYKDDERF